MYVSMYLYLKPQQVLREVEEICHVVLIVHFKSDADVESHVSRRQIKQMESVEVEICCNNEEHANAAKHSLLELKLEETTFMLSNSVREQLHSMSILICIFF
jgi:hypothetical protein